METKFIEVELTDGTKYAINVSQIIYIKEGKDSVYVRFTHGTSLFLKSDSYENVLKKIIS